MLPAPILAVFLATVLSTVYTDTNSRGFDMKDEEFVSKMNDIRRGLANRLLIPNMHELTWSQEHVDNIQSYFGKVGLFHFLPGYKFVVERCTNHLNSIGKNYATENNMRAIQNDMAAGMLAPLYHTIGCGLVAVPDDDLPYYGCAISPLSSLLHIFDGQDIPGSHCAAGYVNNDGLCSLAPTTVGELTTEGTTTETETSPDPESTPEIATTTVASESKSENPSTTVAVQSSEATSGKPDTTPETTPDAPAPTPEVSLEPTKDPKTTIENSTTQSVPKITPEPEPITSEPSPTETTPSSRPEPIPETEPIESTAMTPEGSSSTKFPQRVLGDYDYFHGDWEEFNSSISNNLSLVFIFLLYWLLYSIE